MKRILKTNKSTKSIKKITIYLLVSLFLVTACNKDDDRPDHPNPWGLPNATQSGAGTFGCLINGEPWIAEIGLGIISASLRPFDMTYDETDTGIFYNNHWSMVVKKILKDSIHDIHDGFVIRAWFSEEEILINHVDHRLYFSLIFGDDQGINAFYELDTLSPYTFEITKLDTANNICAGIFDFYAISDDSDEVLHFEEGRFDKKYAPK
ncbi:MAG: hypothetical protein ACJATF_004141 [Flavobacteriales bacterium]|jgi:hypothetical protein